MTYEEGGDTVVSGVANGTFDGNNVTVTLEEDFGFPEQYTAHLLPASEASGNYTPGDMLFSNTSSAVVVSQTARVTTVTGAPDVVVANAPAKDTTGDGLPDDVRGNGSLDILDVQTLFSSREDPVIDDNAELFHFQAGSTPSPSSTCRRCSVSTRTTEPLWNPNAHVRRHLPRSCAGHRPDSTHSLGRVYTTGLPARRTLFTRRGKPVVTAVFSGPENTLSCDRWDRSSV